MSAAASCLVWGMIRVILSPCHMASIRDAAGADQAEGRVPGAFVAIQQKIAMGIFTFSILATAGI